MGSHGLSIILRGGFALAVGMSLLAGCSSSFGGGSSPPPTSTIVVPPGTAAVCRDGSAPPC